jgi:cellulose biosynthesis protein BcsQ
VHYKEKMMTPILTFFNNKSGVGKTSLIYHLAWTYADMGKRVIAADLDPQSNLTAAFLTEDEIDVLWDEVEPNAPALTIYHCVQPLMDVEDIKEPWLRKIAPSLYLIPGNVALSGFEDALSDQWSSSLGERNLYRPLRLLSAFWQVLQMGAEQIDADIILVDIGPNLGAINRSALIATNYVVIPLGADLFSLQGLRNLGPTMQNWKKSWKKRIENWGEKRESKEKPDFKLPTGEMQAIGYVCQQYSVRLDRPVIAYDKWVKRIPAVYRKTVLNQPGLDEMDTDSDPYCLATIKHYRSLVPIGQEHRKPIFKLTPADGAIGAHAEAARSAGKDFQILADEIGKRIENSTSDILN